MFGVILRQSPTRRYFAPNVCQSELTAANPAKEAIKLMPMTPIRSKHPSLNVWS
jgi:hypothetical protein